MGLNAIFMKSVGTAHPTEPSKQLGKCRVGCAHHDRYWTLTASGGAYMKLHCKSFFFDLTGRPPKAGKFFWAGGGADT